MSNKDKKNKISTLEDELKELQNKYLRLLAESENSRQRMQKEKQESLSFAIENTVAEFLPLIDNFENALNFANDSSEEVKNWALGFQMILSQIKDILHSHGIVAYHSVGNRFDPHYHEAVEIVESNEHEPGSVIEEFAKGYKSSNRTIRPARVKVTKQTQLVNEIDDEKSSDKEIEKDLNDSELQVEDTLLEDAIETDEKNQAQGEDIKINK
ncbi:MAG: Protein GrpE [Candidatus Anoxychlamydiales bacterium]|nr:Protein GrpE [Candidatus Anoxychlamydiales bacterium]NGX36619.1 Protein GrpE [Candidatus Anoxychlamydiales bacterium]